MYSIATDEYTCDFCGIEMKRNKSDEIHGEMWGCEICEQNFCSRCLRRAVGSKRYMAIMQDSDRLMCPDCAQMDKYSWCFEDEDRG